MRGRDGGSTPPTPESDAPYQLTVRPIESDTDRYQVGRNDARIGPDLMRMLGMHPSDGMELTGTKTTVAGVFRTDRADWDTESIYLDEFTRQNAGVGVDETIEVRPAIITDAASLVVESSTERPMTLDAETREWARRRLRKWLLVEGDVVPVLDKESSPGSFTHSGALRVVIADPEGPVRVTSETDIEFRATSEP